LALPPENTADFYLLSSYQPLHKLNPARIKQISGFAFAGCLGSAWNGPELFGNNTVKGSASVQKFVKQEFDALFNTFKLSGGFWESFMDWHMRLPSPHSAVLHKGKTVNGSGLYTINRSPKFGIPDFRSLWAGEENALLSAGPKTGHTSLFSLTIIFGTLLFLAIYRKQPRMKENLRKAIRHPYGFFVDMRERRIIPLFNSFMVGAYAALIMGTIIGALLFFFHSSYKLLEFAALFLKPLGVYHFFIVISASPILSLVVSVALFLMFPVFISFVILFFSLLTGERIRYRQGLAIGLWSGIPLFYLMPVSLFIYQLLLASGYLKMISILLFFFVLWSHIRIVNGVRVLFMTRSGKVIAALLLSYLAPLLIFWFFFTPLPLWTDYLKLVLQAQCLF